MKAPARLCRLSLLLTFLLAHAACRSTTVSQGVTDGGASDGGPPIPLDSLALGQPSFTRNLGLERGLSPLALATSGSHLFVASGNRILIWNNLSFANPAPPPDLVLGQPNLDVDVANYGGVSAQSLNSPYGVATDGVRLVVADTGNNRVLIWNRIPTSTGTPADVVLGQPDFGGSEQNSNGSPSSRTFASPNSVYTDGTKLLVSDTINNRVLIWNAFPTTNQQPADVVLGQPNMATQLQGTSSVSAKTLALANGGLTVAAGRLFVADDSNNRILVWNSIPTVNQQPADYALGQPDLSAHGANSGGVSAQSLQFPTRVFSDGSHLAVADTGNGRVLLWNTLPTAPRQAADVVLGAPTMTSPATPSPIVNAQTLGGCFGGSFSAGQLLVSDVYAGRLLGWKTIPTSNQTPADFVVGQPDFSSGVPDTAGISSQTLTGPTSVAACGDRIYIVDSGANRVLGWNTRPAYFQQAADFVLGQPNFSTYDPNHGGILPQTLNSPAYVTCVGSKLFVSDTGNNRILIWNTLPSDSGKPADLVLGQSDLTTGRPNDFGISAQSLSSPRQVYSDGTRLYVVDMNNNRVLIWSQLPVQSHQQADLVLGQNSMSSGSALTPRSGKTTTQPTGVSGDGRHLFVAESTRILIWNTSPSANDQPADLVLGQQNLTANQSYPASAASIGSFVPTVTWAGTKLYATDLSNNRILVWNSVPSVNDQPADGVLGQPDYLSSDSNHGGLSNQGLSQPYGVAYSGTHLFLADYGNSRVLEFLGQ